MNRRWDFYKNCADVVDHFYSSPQLSTDLLKQKYGINTSEALIEELSAQKAIDPTANVAGSMQVLGRMSWLHYTEFYQSKISEERAIWHERRYTERVAYLSLATSIATALLTVTLSIFS